MEPAAALRGVGEQGLAIQLLLLIELPEDCLGHKDLAPDNEMGQRFEAAGDGADGLEILRHVLPTRPSPRVAPLDETPSWYSSATERPSTLGSTSNSAGPSSAPVTRAPNLQLLNGKHVLKALQRDLVDHLLKALSHLAAHPLGEGNRRSPGPVGRLQLLKAAELVVEVVVGQGGVVEYVIVIIGLIQLTPELLYPVFRPSGTSNCLHLNLAAARG